MKPRIVYGIVLCITLASVLEAQSSIQSKIDAIMEPPIKAGRVAGASVAVVKGNETILQKEYGFADIELDVPTPAGATYEIGSVTKQFTAAGILLLAEQGKLSLEDELTKFLPDYPMQGNHVTIRRLLNHTSGIKGYTEIPEFRDFMMMKKPKEELVKMFSSKPFEFKPGEQMIYNNSAFFLLGLIIEKASGKSYRDFVKESLFDRVGMKDSYYCSERAVHKKHAHGYDTERNTLVLKAYVDHSWPYAAGSLCSNTADLVAWNKALHGGKLLKPESYREMTSPGALNDGTKIRYGMGIGVDSADGRRKISHGGAINGFLSESQYYPDDDLIIVVLLNTAGPVNPANLAQQISEAVLGKPADSSRPFTGDLAPFAGTYNGLRRGGLASVRIAADGNQLLLFNTAGANTPGQLLKFYGNDTFGFGGNLVSFEKENGRVTKLRLDTGAGYNILNRRTENQ